ncbi:UNC93-like protein MFSD11 isoform X2 [Paramacrobiotus metropolitanus]|uniref:UNC93-like protein MFSD11 isoform X2 n=1 Tax=Paramacrobiotus metropolitanus TaxID=2943436 RepID=UPI00244580B2|nr:UNC93-like protein MFSD11 isoform X2 [Paramacrobiotus metropolitanus]
MHRLRSVTHYGPFLQVAIIGPKITLVVGGVCTTLFVASLIRPLTSTTYVASVLTTFGTTFVWQVQGHFIAVNSTKKRMSRNTGIFLALFQSSLVFSNLFYFYMLYGKQTIPSETRITTFSILTCAAALGVVVFSLLAHPWCEKIPRPQNCTVAPNEQAKTIHFTPKEAFYAMVRATKTKEILFLLPLFFFTGIEASFWSVYATSLGYTEKFGSLQQALVGLTNVFAGVGEIVAGIFIALTGKWMHYNGRHGILLLGMLIYAVTFGLTFLNIPPRASLETTSDVTYIGPNAYVAMLVSFLLGLGDGIFSGQIIGYLGSRYRDDCITVFAIYSFWSTLGNTAQFSWAMVLTLPFQLLILTIFAVAGTVGFCYVECLSRRNLNNRS